MSEGWVYIGDDVADLRIESYRTFPLGSLVVSPETVAEIKRRRDEADAAWDEHADEESLGVLETCEWFLSLLGVKEEA